MQDYYEMIELMELVPFFRNQMMARFEDLKESHPDKIKAAKRNKTVAIDIQIEIRSLDAIPPEDIVQ